MHYQTHWRLAFVLAFFFHIIAWLFLTILIPHVFKALEPPPQEEPMEWVELADDPGPPEEEQPEEEPKVLRSGEGKQIGIPGKILHAEQPPYGVIQFKGRIAVSARIGTDGKVISTRIQVSSGNALYDRMARRIVEKQWKFEPAKDMNGQPMESDMQCPVYFNMKPARNIK